MHVKRYHFGLFVLILSLLSGSAFCQIDAYHEGMLGKRLRYTPCIVALDDDSSSIKLSIQSTSIKKGSRYIPQEGNDIRNTLLSVLGGTRGEKVSSKGYAAYLNGTKGGNQWCNSISLLEGNPYQLADSSIGKYHIESYAFGGSTAVSLLRNLILGGSFGYHAGVAYRTVDPRPSNRFYRIRSAIGLQYTLGNWSTGIATAIGRRAENVSINVYKPNTKVLLIRMLGMDRIDYLRSSSVDNEGISYDGGEYEISANAGYAGSAGCITAEASLANSRQEHQQSSQVIPYEYNLSNKHFSILYETKAWGVNHYLQARWHLLNGKGTENTYIRQAANSSTSLYNEVKVSSSRKYGYSTSEATLAYTASLGNAISTRYRVFTIQGGCFDWHTSYRYPSQNASYKGISLSASICDRLHIGRFWLEPQLSAQLRRVSHTSLPLFTAENHKFAANYDTIDPKWKELQPTLTSIQQAYIGTLQLLSANRQQVQLSLALSYPVYGHLIVLTPSIEIEQVKSIASYRTLTFSASVQL